MVLLPAIEWVIYHRVADVSHVHADLVGAAGFQLALDPGIVRHELNDTEMGHRRLAGLGLHVPFHAVLGAAPQWEADDPCISFHLPMDQSHIMALGFVGGDFFLQHREGASGLGHHHDAGGVLIQAMHDARADGVFAGVKERRAAVEEQRIHQRAVRISGARMHHHATSLIDHQHVVVFI